MMADTTEITKHYQDLLVSQWVNMPKARSTIKALTDCAVADLLALDIRDAFDINTAVGVQLDDIGAIIGLGRDIYGAIVRPYMELADYTDGDATYGITDYTDSTINPTSVMWRYEYEYAAFYSMSDDEYRALIILKRALNFSDNTLYGIQKFLTDFLGKDVTVYDSQDMSIGYYISAAASRIAQLAASQNLLPKPMGVLLTGVYSVPDSQKVFGFETADTINRGPGTSWGFNVYPKTPYISGFLFVSENKTYSSDFPGVGSVVRMSPDQTKLYLNGTDASQPRLNQFTMDYWPGLISPYTWTAPITMGTVTDFCFSRNDPLVSGGVVYNGNRLYTYDSTNGISEFRARGGDLTFGAFDLLGTLLPHKTPIVPGTLSVFMTFSPDGTRLYTVEHDPNETPFAYYINQYDLGTAWEINTASLLYTTSMPLARPYSDGYGLAECRGITVSDDGTKLTFVWSAWPLELPPTSTSYYQNIVDAYSFTSFGTPWDSRYLWPQEEFQNEGAYRGTGNGRTSMMITPTFRYDVTEDGRIRRYTRQTIGNGNHFLSCLDKI